MKNDVSWATERPLRKAIVIFDTHFGQTGKVAEAIARGIRANQVETDLKKADSVDVATLPEYDLIAVGSPTERLTASPAVRHLLSAMKKVDLKDHYGFAFETRSPHHPSVAARAIESSLESLGLRIRYPFRTALVQDPKGATGSESSEGERHELAEAEEKALESAGSELVHRIRGETEDTWSQ